MARIPATLEDLDEHPEKDDICVNPHCEREVGLAGVFVAGKGRICGSCFRDLKCGIIMDENRELQTIWRK
jgi:hypothetical protein